MSTIRPSMGKFSDMATLFQTLQFAPTIEFSNAFITSLDTFAPSRPNSDLRHFKYFANWTSKTSVIYATICGVMRTCLERVFDILTSCTTFVNDCDSVRSIELVVYGCRSLLFTLFTVFCYIRECLQWDSVSCRIWSNFGKKHSWWSNLFRNSKTFPEQACSERSIERLSFHPSLENGNIYYFVAVYMNIEKYTVFCLNLCAFEKTRPAYIVFKYYGNLVKHKISAVEETRILLIESIE